MTGLQWALVVSGAGECLVRRDAHRGGGVDRMLVRVDVGAAAVPAGAVRRRAVPR